MWHKYSTEYEKQTHRKNIRETSTGNTKSKSRKSSRTNKLNSHWFENINKLN